MVDTAAKGRRFEYLIRDIFFEMGYVVSRCAASKPWDLTISTPRATYAIECKVLLTGKSIIDEYNRLKEKLRVVVNTKDGEIKVQSALRPLLFYGNSKGWVEMYSRTCIVSSDGTAWRPYFDGTSFKEIPALGDCEENE